MDVVPARVTFQHWYKDINQDDQWRKTFNVDTPLQPFGYSPLSYFSQLVAQCPSGWGTSATDLRQADYPHGLLWEYYYQITLRGSCDTPVFYQNAFLSYPRGTPSCPGMSSCQQAWASDDKGGTRCGEGRAHWLGSGTVGSELT